MKREDMVGVYRQLGEDAVNAAGEITYSNNERNSQIMYSPDGYVGVISAPANRKKVSGSDNRTDLNGASRRGARRGGGRSDLLRRALRAEGRQRVPPHRDGAQPEPDRPDADPARAYRRPPISRCRRCRTRMAIIAASNGGGCRASNAYKINRLRSAFLARSPMCLLHVGGVDLHRLAGAVGARERNLVEHALHHGLQPPRADVLDAGVHRHRDVGDGVDGVRR